MEYTNQTDSFLDKSTKSHIDSPYSVFKDKKVVSQWEHELNPYIIKEITNDLSETRLEKYIK